MSTETVYPQPRFWRGLVSSLFDCPYARIPTASSSKKSNNECPKCGTITKSGRRSCCARGGAWFKKCGDAGDSNYDHTWTEGIEACSQFSGLVSIISPAQVTLHHVGVIAQRNKSKGVWITTRQKSMYPSGGLSNAGSANFKDCSGIAKVAESICVWLFIHLCLRT